MRLLLRLAYGKAAEYLATWVFRYIRFMRGRKLAEQWLLHYSFGLRPSDLTIIPPQFTLPGAAFRAMVRYRVDRKLIMIERRPLRTPKGHLKIGCIGPFSGLLSFGVDFFRAVPQDIDLHIFDVTYGKRTLTALKNLPLSYNSFDLDRSDPQVALEEIAREIRSAGLDALFNFWHKIPLTLLDLVDVPCLVNVCTGSELLWHPSTSIQIYSQYMPGSRLFGRRLWCRYTGVPVSESDVYDVGMIYDARDLAGEPLVPWAERKPYIFSFGTVEKMTNRSFLQCIFQVLNLEPEVDFVFMGRASDEVLKTIFEAATSAGLSERVHYDGVFSAIRTSDGQISDPGWLRCKEHLRRARAVADTFPNTGGSTRVEAYLLGAPMPYMDIPPDVGNGQRSYADFSLPILSVPEMVTYERASFTEKLLRCCRDEAFANRAALHQRRVVKVAIDSGRWWRESLASYCDWLFRNGKQSAA